MTSVAFAPSTRELVLGRYRPLRPLGSGGSGSVWLAVDDRTGLDVALKVIPREGKAAARAEREALAAKRLRHDRCVRAYDVDHDTSHVYIAYEYVPGRTLRETLRAGVLTDADVVEIAAQVLDALAHAHRTGIVHRDVKPSNILLEDGAELGIRLLDFGLAQFDGADTLTAVGDVPGTLAYIAPERLSGDEATPESDVWSVGVVLWEALAERHPFWGVPLQEVASSIQAGAPPLARERADLPRRLVAAIDGALSLHPERRPRASELASQLRGALRETPKNERAAAAENDLAEPSAPALALARRVAPIGLAAVTAALGATLLPFWPSALVAAIVVVAGVGAWLDPRLGLLIALAAPIFPIGNASESAAVLYGLFALTWVALTWRDPRNGLLFVSGPLLAPLGLLALVPLAVQPARGAVRQAAHAAVAILSAVLMAGASSGTLPLTSGSARAPQIAPGASWNGVANSLWTMLATQPVIPLGAVVVGVAAALLPQARRRSRYGVAVVGLALTACTVAAGDGFAGTALVALVWAGAAAMAAGWRGRLPAQRLRGGSASLAR